MKFARPNSYNGKQGTQSWTGQARFANATEAAAGDSTTLIISPATLESAVTTLVPAASTTVAGLIEIATDAEATAGISTTLAMTPHTVGLVAIAGAPLASEILAGIAELATQTETNTGTDDARIVTPLKLKTNLTTPPAIGGTTPASGAFTSLQATGVGTGNVMTSDTASSFGVTGAGIDLTLASSGGRVVVNGEEAAADALRLLSAAGGLDVDVALQMNLVSSQNAADAIVINASAGGIDITAAGAVAEDIDIVCTAGSINITAGESAANSIVITSSIGGIDILAAGAAAGEDIDIIATGSSVNITATENAADAIVITASAGGIDVACTGTAGEDIDITATGSSVNITATEDAADSIVISSTNGGIDITAAGAAAGEDIDITATGSSINLTSTENAALAIYLHANGGVSETIRARADQGTGAASVELISDVGGVTITAGLGTADAINLNCTDAAGGIDIDSGTSGIIADTTGAISLDAAAASNFTVTGAFALDVITTLGKLSVQSGQSAADSIEIKSLIGGIDILAAGAAAGEDIDIVATGSSVNIQATESDVNAITINASGVAGGINVDSGTSGVIVDTTGAISLDAAAASNLTVTGAFALDVITTLGKLSLQSGQSAADSVEIKSLIGGIDILAAGAAAGEDIDIIATGSSINITSTESAADSIVITSSAGGIDILASGAAAGEDIDIVATGSSVNITATENVSDAIVINASGAASGISIDCGTVGVTIGTGMIHAITSVATAATPYAVLGTDYLISTDSTGGALEITLPAAPATGRTLIVYDGTGQAAIGGNVTINGNGKNIAASGTSAATKLINTAYESYTLYYNGTLWLGQGVV